MFKHAFDTRGLENVEDITAEQYTEALDMVHEQLSTHQHPRKSWKLENAFFVAVCPFQILSFQDPGPAKILKS